MKPKTIIFLCLTMALFSCGPNWDNPDELLELIPEAKEWIIDDPEHLFFEMKGTDSSYYAIKELNSGYYNSGSATGEGLGYYVVASINYDQYFELNGEQLQYYIKLECSDQGSNGNLLMVHLLGTEWSYDFTYDRLHFVHLKSEKGNEFLFNNELTSECVLLDTLTINQTRCDSIFHFQLNDFQTILDDESVVEVYYAKHIGLVKFVLHNGVEVERKW